MFVDALFLEALRGMLISGPVLLYCSGNFVTRQKDANLFEFICDLFYIKRRTYGNFESFFSLNIFKSMLDEVNFTTRMECDCNFCT